MKDDVRRGGIDEALLRDIAAEAATAFNNGARQVQPFSARYPDLRMDDAYRIAALANGMRVAKGYRPVGRKIGFTNRRIWDEYGVHAPVWGYVYDRTVYDLPIGSSSFRGASEGSEPGIQKNTRSLLLDSGSGPEPAIGPAIGRTRWGRPGMTEEGLPLAPYSDPKIEPEIMFGLARAPSPGLDDAALLACISWVAHGYEIVQSIYPDWKFTPPDAVIVDGHHAALLIGARHEIGTNTAEWLRTLASFEIELFCEGKLMDKGHALNVLEGPLSTIRYLMDLLARDPDNPPLAAGEIISTGTLTRALPVKPGETWTTKLKGIALEDISLRFE
ncbi:MAG TPA: hydratase [Pseudolabrys sp.]|nr:hydratase [Pseudolabrys sp.]